MQPLICDPASPGLFSAEGFVGLLFLGALGIVVAGAMVATMSRHLIRAIAGLALCFFGVAVLYFYLGGPFVAMMQILIYVGAVSIIIAFGIMLANPEDRAAGLMMQGNVLVGPLGFAMAMILFAALSVMGVRTQWQQFARIGDGSMKDMGAILLTSHGMVFELISFVLLIAILGAIVLARRGRYAAVKIEQES